MDRWTRATKRGERVFLFVLALIITLCVQSVFPVCAVAAEAGNETAETEQEDAETGNEAAESKDDAASAGRDAGQTSGKDTAGSSLSEGENTAIYELDHFDRIAVNSVRGTLTIRSGEDFGISFPAGWEEPPAFSVQDEILVVSGRKAGSEDVGESGGQSESGSAVVIGEDEPAESAGQGAARDGDGTPKDGSDAAEDDGASPAGEGAGGDSAPQAGEGAGGEGASHAGTAAESAEAAAAGPEMVITIPAGASLDTLRVAMEEGNLVLTDITAGSVTIQSGGGSLALENVSLGTVDIYTDSGKISMAESSFGTLNIGMGEGEIRISAQEDLSGCRMELKTGSGEILIGGEAQGEQYLQPGNGKRFLTVQVGSGDIHIDS